jgi:hypothetical protein
MRRPQTGSGTKAGSLKHLANRSPSLGLLHLAAQVRQHGYEPTILESDILGEQNRMQTNLDMRPDPPAAGAA